jgi:hypothetical protein
MSINADNIIGTYDIHSKQYILTFASKPTPVPVPTDCSFTISATEVIDIIPPAEPSTDDCSFSIAAVFAGSSTATITGPTTGTTGTNITLTGEDNGFTGTNWTWGGGAINGVTGAGEKVQTFTESTAGTVTYDVSIAASSGGPYTDTHQVVWSAPAAPSVGIVGPSTGDINTNITLTGEDYNFTGSTWAWTGGSAQGLTTKTITVNESSTGAVQYGVTVDGTYTASKTITYSDPSACTNCGETINSISNQTIVEGGNSTTIAVTGTGVATWDITQIAGSSLGSVSIVKNSSTSATITYVSNSNGLTGTDTMRVDAFGGSNCCGTSTQFNMVVTAQPTPPTFTCNDAQFNVIDGTTGQNITFGAPTSDATVQAGTLTAVSPNVYQSGLATYTATITIPSGYQNAGGSITTCTNTATGSAATSSYTRNMSLSEGVVDNPTYGITWSDSGQTANLIGNGATKINTQTLTSSSISATVSRTSPDATADDTVDIVWTRQNSGGAQQETSTTTIQTGYSVTNQGYTFTNVSDGDILYVQISEG